jgi:hypothetical protein
MLLFCHFFGEIFFKIITLVPGHSRFFFRQDSLKHYREEKRDVGVADRDASAECRRDDCVRSHFVTTDWIAGHVAVADVVDQNTFLENLGMLCKTAGWNPSTYEFTTSAVHTYLQIDFFFKKLSPLP